MRTNERIWCSARKTGAGKYHAIYSRCWDQDGRPLSQSGEDTTSEFDDAVSAVKRAREKAREAFGHSDID